jgi:putative hydrolase of the HAD superfamily
MIKAICFDLDGVVLKKRETFFSDKLSEKLNISTEKILPFFKKEYKEIVVGKSDLKNGLEKYLSDWGWTDSLDDLLDFWFASENDIDKQVLETVKKLRVLDFKVFLASDHALERAENVRNTLGLKLYFDGDFFSYDIGHTKESREYFDEIIKRIDLDPREIFFIDDDEKNLGFAKNAGLQTIYFESFDKYLEELKKLGIDLAEK